MSFIKVCIFLVAHIFQENEVVNKNILKADLFFLGTFSTPRYSMSPSDVREFATTKLTTRAQRNILALHEIFTKHDYRPCSNNHSGSVIVVVDFYLVGDGEISYAVSAFEIRNLTEGLCAEINPDWLREFSFDFMIAN